jgi:hypothetical protein
VAKKRREAQLVQLKIRLRERLRQRLEYAAKQEEIPLSHEIVRRLENSFEQQQLVILLEYMLAPGMSLDLFKALAQILAELKPNWQKSEDRHLIAVAIYKVIAAYIGELPATAESFPERDKYSADLLAWEAVSLHLRSLLPPPMSPPDKRRLIEQEVRQRQELRQIEDAQRFKALAPTATPTPPDQEPDLPAPRRPKGSKT